MGRRRGRQGCFCSSFTNKHARPLLLVERSSLRGVVRLVVVQQAAVAHRWWWWWWWEVAEPSVGRTSAQTRQLPAHPSTALEGGLSIRQRPRIFTVGPTPHLRECFTIARPTALIQSSFSCVLQCIAVCGGERRHLSLQGQLNTARAAAAAVKQEGCLLLCSSQHSTAQHSTAQHSTAQHSTAQHSTAQHSTAQHSTTPKGGAPPHTPPTHLVRICDEEHVVVCR